jgi:hypothetical protein
MPQQQGAQHGHASTQKKIDRMDNWSGKISNESMDKYPGRINGWRMDNWPDKNKM